MSEADTVLVERDGPVTIVSINRPHCRNAVDGATARKLYGTRFSPSMPTRRHQLRYSQAPAAISVRAPT